MQREFAPAVYLLASRRNGTHYVGVTSNLVARIYQHRGGVIAGFSRDYGVKLLVWFEMHATMNSAIPREKRIEKWHRAWQPEVARPCRESRLRSAPMSGSAGFPLSRE